jgi:hypothetical protein
MLQDWEKYGKSGKIVYPQGEVVYQKEPHVRVEPIYETVEGKRYIEILNPNQFIEIDGRKYVQVDEANTILVNGERYIKTVGACLQEVTTNPFNGYCYRQDGE